MAVREFISSALADSGHHMTAATNSLRALEPLARDHFYLLLSYIVGPETDGIALVLKVSRDLLELPIVLMNGYAAERQCPPHKRDALIQDHDP